MFCDVIYVVCKKDTNFTPFRIFHNFLKWSDIFWYELIWQKTKKPVNQTIYRLLMLFDFPICRDDWIRTSDPVVPNDVRYQTALHPVVSGIANLQLLLNSHHYFHQKTSTDYIAFLVNHIKDIWIFYLKSVNCIQ